MINRKTSQAKKKFMIKEYVYELSNKQVAAIYNRQHTKPLDERDNQIVTLMLHGWLDNAASFLPLFDYLDAFNLVAVDLQGHGKSSHRPISSDYNLVDYVQDVYQLVTEQKWDKINLVGHSLGGIIGAMFCACFPEKVNRFVCIETAGPLTEPEDTSVQQLRESIISRVKSASSVVKQPKSLEQIIASRMKVSDLNEQNARIILQRNIEYSKDNSEIVWRTDHRLRTKSSIRLTEPQALNIIENIEAPSLLLLGDKGFDKVKRNYDKRKSHYKALKMKVVSGGHHVHMDSPKAVADNIRAFLQQ